MTISTTETIASTAVTGACCYLCGAKPYSHAKGRFACGGHGRCAGRPAIQMLVAATCSFVRREGEFAVIAGDGKLLGTGCSAASAWRDALGTVRSIRIRAAAAVG